MRRLAAALPPRACSLGGIDFGVRRLAAALSPASLLAVISAWGAIPASKPALWSAAACRRFSPASLLACRLAGYNRQAAARPASWPFGVRRLAAAFPPRACSRAASLGTIDKPRLGQQAGPLECGGLLPHSKAGALQESRRLLCAIGLTARFTAWQSLELT